MPGPPDLEGIELEVNEPLVIDPNVIASPALSGIEFEGDFPTEIPIAKQPIFDEGVKRQIFKDGDKGAAPLIFS